MHIIKLFSCNNSKIMLNIPHICCSWNLNCLSFRYPNKSTSNLEFREGLPVFHGMFKMEFKYIYIYIKKGINLPGQFLWCFCTSFYQTLKWLFPSCVLVKCILNVFLMIIHPWKLMIQVVVCSSSWWKNIRWLIRQCFWHKYQILKATRGKKGNSPQVHLLNRIWNKSGKLEECFQTSPSEKKVGWGRWITHCNLPSSPVSSSGLIHWTTLGDFVFNFEPFQTSETESNMGFVSWIHRHHCQKKG